MRAVPAASLEPHRLVDLWNAVYAGYFVPMSWDLAQLERHVAVGSINLERSLVWLDGGASVALSLLGTRTADAGAAGPAHSKGEADQSSVPNLRRCTPSSDHDLPSATQAPGARSGPSTSQSSGQGLRGWIGGFGIVESHRGRGLSTSLMLEQLAVASESGVRRLQLEVLTQNWAARSYERAGFVTTRRLTVLQGVLTGAQQDSAGAAASWLDPAEVPDLAGQLARLHSVYRPAWTREPQATLWAADGVRCLVVGSVGAAEGVALVRRHAGVVHVLETAAAGAPSAQALVGELAAEYGGLECRVVNEPEGSPLVAALAAGGLVEVLAQHEMHWTS